MVAKLLLHFGTEDQKRRYLPRMATGEIRATMALTEPAGGSNLQAMNTIARCELSFEDYRAPADALLGGVEGKGFAQMMKGLETGRIQVAARALGVGRAAPEDALTYAQQRESFGKPIWRHQSIGNYLAETAVQIALNVIVSLLVKRGGLDG